METTPHQRRFSTRQLTPFLSSQRIERPIVQLPVERDALAEASQIQREDRIGKAIDLDAISSSVRIDGPAWPRDIVNTQIPVCFHLVR